MAQLSAEGNRLQPDGMRARRLQMPRTVAALVLREIDSTYGRSPGGYLWVIIEPVLGLMLLTLVFSMFLRSPALGVNFPLFYATGFLPFMMFNSLANKMATAIVFSRPLLAYPAITFVDALLARFLLALLTHLLVCYLIFTALVLVYDTRTILHLPPVLAGLAMAAVLGFGVGTVNCYLMTAFPIWERIWSILTRPLFIASCIFFVFDDLPRMVKEILWYNPLIHVVGMVRRGFYASYHASYVSPVYVLSLGGGLTVLGLLLLWRNYRRLLQK